jgi:hypothetical protein
MIDEEGQKVEAPNEAIETKESESAEEKDDAVVNKLKNKKPSSGGNKTLIIIVAVLAVLVVAVGAYASFNYYKDKQDAKVTATVTPTATASVSVTVTADDRVVDEGVTWIKPEKMEDQKLFDVSSTGDCQSTAIDYYKVGTTSSGGVIIDANLNCGMGGLYLERLIKSDTETKLITKNSTKLDANVQVAVGTNPDSSFVFNSLLPDQTITKGLTQLISSESQKFDTNKSWVTSTKKLASTKWGNLNLDFSKDLSLNSVDSQNPDKTPVLKIGSYDLSLNDTADQNYEVRPSFLQSDNTFDLTYAMAAAKTNKYDKFETGGCGIGFGSSPIIADPSLIVGAVEIGSKGSSKVYTMNDVNSKLVQYSYAVYKMDGAAGKKTIQQFVDDIGLAFWTDDYGNTIAFLNSDYKPAVECGKPVVYLYPEKTTSFTVKVGAQMTKTDPAYDGKWQGVAEPNGQLTVAGNIYPYLFWEGLGYGVYPTIDFGRIVERSSVESEIRSDLSAMNLNAQETADFLDFWMPKMPDSKYVRLSWLTNKEMDKLAQMSISPKPQSIIRVFLDFSGLNSKIDLKSQVLPTFARTGFTAVEWGGLLKGN